mmetsp:Transcript_95959/g.299715  ORF Transcript_95959/g.299715 Transcript_95959/m.299715 type:complete len:227 (+) Transcript_95959:713-1393(+)
MPGKMLRQLSAPPAPRAPRGVLLANVDTRFDFAQLVGELLLERVVPLLHGGEHVLHKPGGCLGLRILHAVHCLDELLRVDLTAAILVAHLKEQAKIRGINVQDAKPMPELDDPARAVHHLVDRDAPVHVLVDLLEDLAPHLLLLALLGLHLVAAPQDVLCAGLCEGINHHRRGQVQDAEDDGEQGAHEDGRRPWPELDDREGHGAPAVPRDDGLEESEVRLEDGVE